MRIHLKKAVTIAVLTAALCCVGAFASFTSELDVVNRFVLDTVDIELESNVSEDALYLSVDGESVPALLDDAAVEHDIVITNKGVSCYIRCKSTYTKLSEEGSLSSVSFDATGNIVTDSASWYLAEDGYLYYKEVLGEGKVVSLTELISNAPEWRNKLVENGEELRGFEMAANFTVEAVQSRNFEPDFTSGKPWGDIEPEICVYSRNGA